MSKMFVSLRQQNLKMGQLGKASDHNLRQIPVANADPDGHFERVYGNKDMDLEQLLMAHLDGLGAVFSKMGVKQKNDSDRSRQTTVINEFVLSASPEFFRPGRPEAAGEYDQERLDEWLKIAIEWAKKEFGQHLLAIDLHCDESTPHLHICVAPLVEKTKNLRRTKTEIAEGAAPRTATVWSFNNLEINTPESMRERQTSAAEAFKSLGLRRGVPSKAKHEDVKAYYRRINAAIEALIPAKNSEKNLSKLKIDEPPSVFSLIRSNAWIKKAYRKITETFPRLLEKETERADKMQTERDRFLDIAKKYRDQYAALRDAQLDIYDRFGNNPVALTHHMGQMTNKQRQLEADMEKIFHDGIIKGRAGQQKALDDQKEDFKGEIQRLITAVHDLQISNGELSGKLEDAVKEAEEWRGKAEALHALRLAKTRGSDIERAR
jgi:hypothetical protein